MCFLWGMNWFLICILFRRKSVSKESSARRRQWETYSVTRKLFQIRSCLVKERCILMTVNFTWLSTGVWNHWLHGVNGYTSAGIYCHDIFFYSSTFWAPYQTVHLYTDGNIWWTLCVHTAQCSVMNTKTRVTPAINCTVGVRFPGGASLFSSHYPPGWLWSPPNLLSDR
jgi:hypothetical protein